MAAAARNDSSSDAMSSSGLVSSSSSLMLNNSEFTHTAQSFMHAPTALVMTFAPGAAQGVTSVVFGHPLDTAKTRMQASGPRAQRSVLATMFQVASNEGVLSLYRGVVPPLIMEGTKRSIQFALWDMFRRAGQYPRADMRRHRSASDGDVSALLPHWRERVDIASEEARYRFDRLLAYIGHSPFRAGAVAGGLGTIIGCPMHVIKIQTQNQTRMGTRNAWTCTLDIWRNDGPLGFYRGVKYNLLKDVCFASSYLGLFSVLRDGIKRAGSELPSDMAPGTSAAQQPLVNRVAASMSPSAVAFTAGAVASMSTWLVFFPLDTVKTLVQSKQSHLLAGMWSHPGRLYRGITASLLKAGPVSGASMAAYDATKRGMDRWKERRSETTLPALQ